VTDAFVVPELTLGLRNFAAPSALGDIHSKFFVPLLDARRAAAIAGRWNARVTAFDADRLDATMRMTLAELANERYPKSPPDRRALTAQLEDACGDFFDALDMLREAQRSILDDHDDARRTALWNEWIANLRGVFSAADRGWEQIQPVLAAAPPPAGRSRRRVRREFGR
jgi:hypothetical protein